MTHTNRLLIGLSVMTALSLSIASTADAQEQTEPRRFNVFGTSTTSSTTSTGLNLTYFTMVTLEEQGIKRLDHYIATNTPEVQQGLATGAGPSTKDLAYFFGVSQQNHTAFAHMLRRERTTLQKTISGKRDTAAFIKHVKRNMAWHTPKM